MLSLLALTGCDGEPLIDPRPEGVQETLQIQIEPPPAPDQAFIRQVIWMPWETAWRMKVVLLDVDAGLMAVLMEIIGPDLEFRDQPAFQLLVMVDLTTQQIHDAHFLPRLVDVRGLKMASPVDEGHYAFLSNDADVGIVHWNAVIGFHQEAWPEDAQCSGFHRAGYENYGQQVPTMVSCRYGPIPGPIPGWTYVFGSDEQGLVYRDTGRQLTSHFLESEIFPTEGGAGEPAIGTRDAPNDPFVQAVYLRDHMRSPDDAVPFALTLPPFSVHRFDSSNFPVFGAAIGWNGETSLWIDERLGNDFRAMASVTDGEVANSRFSVQPLFDPLYGDRAVVSVDYCMAAQDGVYACESIVNTDRETRVGVFLITVDVELGEEDNVPTWIPRITPTQY